MTLFSVKRYFGAFTISGILLFYFYQSANSQLINTTPEDSARAVEYGYWFNPDHYQFETQFPSLQNVPPLTTDMDYEMMIAYIYLDSLMRNADRDFIYENYLNRWKEEKARNDTIYGAIKYLYKLVDYDPVRFNQYKYRLDTAYYKLGLIFYDGIVSEYLYDLIMNSPDEQFLTELIRADYILKIYVNSVDSIPRREYPEGAIKPGQYVYRVNATVLDTLKGNVFQQCTIDYPSQKKKDIDNELNSLSNICFDYVTGPYSNSYSPFKVDPLLKNSNGKLSISPGRELVVTLSYGNYLFDYDFDYLSLSLIRAFPVVNGQVKDISHFWGNSDLLDYAEWKNIFISKRDLLLSGGY